MKTIQKFKSLITVAVLGSFLAACSGGESGDSTGTKTPTNPNATNPFKPSTIPPVLGSGPINVGASGDDTIEEISSQNEEILSKLDEISEDVDSVKDDANDANKNSKWAKYLGIGIASAIGLQMLYKGWVNGTETGSFMNGLKGFFFGSTREADQKKDQEIATNTVQATQSAAAWSAWAAAAGVGGAAQQAITKTGEEIIKVQEAGTGAIITEVGGAKAAAVDAGSKAADAGKDARDAGNKAKEVKELVQGLVNETNVKLTQTEADLKAAQESLSQTRVELSALQASSDADKANFAQTKEDLEKRLAAVNTELEAREKAIGELRNSLTENANNISSLNADKAKLEQEIESLAQARVSADQLRTELTKVKSDMSHQQDAQALIKDIEKLVIDGQSVDAKYNDATFHIAQVNDTDLQKSLFGDLYDAMNPAKQ